MRRLLLVTHRSIEQAGGPAARWRAFRRYLPEYDWRVDVLSAAEHVGASEFESNSARSVATRAALMARVARLSEPAFRLAGARPDALPLSTLWIAHGALLVKRSVERDPPDVVLASGPPIAGPIAARIGVAGRVPLVVELRDLWAGNPAFDMGGPILARIEEWLLDRARRVVACTPEAVSDLRMRHPGIGERVVEISNGFDPEIGSLARTGTTEQAPAEGIAETAEKDHTPLRVVRTHDSKRTLTLLHSGTLTPARPLAPLLQALEDPRIAGSFRLVLHGYLSPASRAEVESARQSSGVPIEVLPPSPWREAVERIASADAGLITQARVAGDETAVASKIYEYLALNKPVLCVTDGGASEALLRRLEADELCARLDIPETIVAALARLRAGTRRPLLPERLEPYSRRALAGRMAALLEDVAGGG
jgi:hypothetical protein